MRRLLPKRLGAGRVHRPDVPLVETDLQMPFGAHFGTHIFDGRFQRADILVHVVGRTQEVLQRALPRLVVLIVAVHGEIVDRLIGVFEDNAIPFGEGLHLVIGRARDDELQIVRRVLFVFAVRPAHDFGGFERLFAVLVGAQVPRLPGAVHLVADAPVFDVVRLFRPVFTTQIGDGRAARMIAVFDEVRRIEDGARAHIHRHHGRDARLFAPLHELIGAELVGLRREPCKIEAGGPLLAGADAVPPVVPRKEVAARIAHDGHIQLADEPDDVLAEAVFVRRGMPGLIDALVHRAPQMLDERAEEVAVDLAHPKVGICKNFRFHHFLPKRKLYGSN